MSRQKLIENPEIMHEQLQLDFWPSVDIYQLSDEDRVIFDARKRAVELYFRNENTLKEINDITGIAPRKLRDFVHRCIMVDKNGMLWGFRGLIPNKNIMPYTKIKSRSGFHDSTKTGEFTLLLNKYPELKNQIDDLYLGRLSKEAKDPVMKPKAIFKHFINKCVDLGIKLNAYPFNTDYHGYRSLARYLKKLKLIHFGESSHRYGEAAAQKAHNSGIGEQNHPSNIRPYSLVQFDAHRIDAVFAITIRTIEGDYVTRVLERLYVLSILDVATRNVIAHHISLNKEYTKIDVMTCVRKAVIPYKRMDLTIPGLSYNPDGGFPSEKFKEAEWAIWETISMDNAKSNLSNLVKERLENLIGCAVNTGPVGKPMRRGHLERFFQTLEENGFHRTPNTTGSNFKDPRRNDPDKKAIKFYINLDHLEEIIEVLISNYNGMSHEGVNFLSPLAAMEQRLERGLLPKTINEKKRSELAFLQVKLNRKICGDTKSGKRPYINYAGVEYRSDILVHSAELIGVTLELHVNVDDIRFLKAFLPDGSELGILVATGRWGITPHSLKMRVEIMKLKKIKLIHFLDNECPIISYQNFLAEEAANYKKSSANKYIQVERNLNDTVSKDSQDIHTVKEIMIEKIKNSNRIQESDEMPEEFKTISF